MFNFSPTVSKKNATRIKSTKPSHVRSATSKAKELGILIVGVTYYDNNLIYASTDKGSYVLSNKDQVVNGRKIYYSKMNGGTVRFILTEPLNVKDTSNKYRYRDNTFVKGYLYNNKIYVTQNSKQRLFL